MDQAVASGTSNSPANESGVGERLRALPTWVSVLAVALVLGGAGYFVYRQWFAAPSVGEEIDVGHVTMPGRGFGGRRAGMGGPPPQVAQAPDGITQATGPANLARAKSGDFFILAALKPAAGASPSLFYARNDLLPPEQLDLLNARREIMLDSRLAKSLNLSGAQIEQLGKIPLPPRGQGLKLDQADRDRLAAEWKAHTDAPKDSDAKKSAETTLLASIREIGEKALPVTRQQYAQLADQVKQVLTPEQIQQYRTRAR
jgi:hypothetical protein